MYVCNKYVKGWHLPNPEYIIYFIIYKLYHST